MNLTLSLKEISKVAEPLLEALEGRRVMTLEGDLGAGKTTLIQELLRRLGSEDTVSSPTFSLINEYHSPSGTVYHMDLYRIEDEEELHDIGFLDILESGNLILIEWPQIAGQLIPEDAVRVSIEHQGDERKYEWT